MQEWFYKCAHKDSSLRVIWPFIIEDIQPEETISYMLFKDNGDKNAYLDTSMAASLHGDFIAPTAKTDLKVFSKKYVLEYEKEKHKNNKSSKTFWLRFPGAYLPGLLSSAINDLDDCGFNNYVFNITAQRMSTMKEVDLFRRYKSRGIEDAIKKYQKLQEMQEAIFKMLMLLRVYSDSEDPQYVYRFLRPAWRSRSIGLLSAHNSTVIADAKTKKRLQDINMFGTQNADQVGFHICSTSVVSTMLP